MIDNKLYGRKWMMIIGFMADFILFIVPAFHFEYFTQPEHVHAFQAMYFLSSFFNQFGPNSVSFLVAAEVFRAGRGAAAGDDHVLHGRARQQVGDELVTDVGALPDAWLAGVTTKDGKPGLEAVKSELGL